MNNGNKWKITAIVEGILIILAVAFVIGFMAGRKGNTQKELPAAAEAGSRAETTEAVTESTSESKGIENIKESESSDKQEESKEIAKTPEIGEAFTGIKATFEPQQGWESGDDHYYSYKLIIENTSGKTAGNWVIKVPVSDKFSVNSYWNAECVVSDGYLYITPVEFNSNIEAGAKDESVGLIVVSDKEPDFSKAVIGALKKEQAEQVKGADVINDYSGKLHVEGINLVNDKNEAVQLRGISTHGITMFPEYVNYESFKTIHDDFNANVIRLALYSAENGGYCTGGNKDELKKLVKDGVGYATELSMYVIIDWHILSDNNPNTYINEAKDFFDEMSKEFASNDNVLYEICNEPNGQTSWSDVKKYAGEIIPVIRKNDKDGVILVGTPTWSQDVDKAAKDPITGYDNIMYVFHFYAATHKDDLRNKVIKALDDGLAVFISEFSICDASGNGGIDYDSAQKWLDVINTYGLSYVGWNLSNKNETSAILKPSCKKLSGYTMDDLSDTGKWLVETFK